MAHKEKRWWPHYLLKLGGVMLVVTVLIAWLATLFPVPDDAPLEIPFPDHGENVPGPEWIFTAFWIPFWYLKGRLAKYLFIMPTVPIIIAFLLILLPFIDRLPWGKVPVVNKLLKKIVSMKSGFKKSFTFAIPAIILGIFLTVGIYKSGHQAKILGCDSCHNPAMGPRMAIPPVDVFGYYKIDRARQVGVGKYRAGKTMGTDESGEMLQHNVAEVEGYKDANWQMRHMYEPTFTW